MEQLTIPTRTIFAFAASLRRDLLLSARRYSQSRTIIAFTLLFASYAAGSLISLEVFTHSAPSIFWIPGGIALAILFLEGIDLWPAVFLGAFSSSLLLFGQPFYIALGLAISSTLQSTLAVYLLRQSKFTPMLANLRDIIILTFVAMLSSLLSTLIMLAVIWGTTAFTSAGLVDMIGHVWIGKALSLLVLGPFILRWFTRWPSRRTPRQLLEWAIALSLLTALSYIVFCTPYNHFGSMPLVYSVLVPLIWLAISIGPRGTTLGLFILTAVSLAGTLYGTSDPMSAQIPLSTRLVQVEMFDTIIAIIFLIFVSSEEGRKVASRALQEHIVQLERALTRISTEDRAKNEFLAILAHELRNPLAPVLSSIELLRFHPVGEQESAEILSTVDDRVRTMARLLDDLLDISRISQKKFKLQKETVDLRTILDRSVQTARVLMRNKGQTLVVSIPEGPIWITGDPLRLEQIVVNLLNNAAKYTPAGGSIALICELAPAEISIRVRDSGMGIPREMLGRIFEPFLQVQQSGRSEGLGIGLSLAKRLVEMHQGTIEATSDGLGRGSEFTVRLPIPAVIQLPMPITGRLRGRKSPLPAKRHFSILVVDDNRLAAEGLGKLLAHNGHTMSLAFSGEEAIARATQDNPDIVILDIGLPDKDGYAVIKELKGDKKSHAFFIALTGFGQESDKLKSRQAGFDHHLTKPVGLSDVEAVLAKVSVTA